MSGVIALMRDRHFTAMLPLFYPVEGCRAAPCLTVRSKPSPKEPASPVAPAARTRARRPHCYSPPDHDHLLAPVGMPLDEVMGDVGKIIAGDTEEIRIVVVAGGEHDRGSRIGLSSAGGRLAPEISADPDSPVSGDTTASSTGRISSP